MIKKSYFRTIGRVLAYITIAILICLLSNFLGIANVHATDNISYRLDKYGTKKFILSSSKSGDVTYSDNFTTRKFRLGFFQLQYPEGLFTPTSAFWSLSQITIPTNLLQGRDSIAFMVASDMGYYASASMQINGAWGQCSAISLPTGVTDEANTISFTSFVCNYDSSQLSSNADTTFNIYLPLTIYFKSGADSVLTKPHFYFGVDISIYSSSTGSVQDTIIQQTEELNEEQKKTNDKLDDLNDSITSTDTSGAEGSAGGFFSDFDDKDYGLSDIITMPLELIKGITSNSCTPLKLPIPFVNTDVTLPCMTSVYNEFFGDLLDIYQTITTGMIAYWICVNLFAMVKGFKNADSDNVEVLEL